MAQSASSRMVFNVLLVLILLATITYADIDSCRKFCNKHRPDPDGSLNGYSITCAEASSRKGTEMSSCKKECESCSKLCSNENFKCPRAEAFLTSYSSDSDDSTTRTPNVGFTIIFLLLASSPIAVPICIIICACVLGRQRHRAQNQYHMGYGQPPVGQMPVYQPYQPQVGGATGTPGTGQPQNYQA